ncbi:unnamed protein product [Schistosoma turkestanicum]|nr:unnamed protein product [Schistosoma turkestanicum]
MDRKPSVSPVIKDTESSSSSSSSSEKRRYSVQNASGPGGLPPRISPRLTPYLNLPITSAGSTPVSPATSRASIACNYANTWRMPNDRSILRTSLSVPLSIQAQLQQSQAVKSDQPSIVKSTTSAPLAKTFVTPKVSISKVPDPELDPTKKLGRLPKSFQCSCCQHVTVTRTTYHVGVLTWLMAVLIFLCGGVLGCFLIPFFTNCCKDVKHECPFCGTEIGVVKCI